MRTDDLSLPDDMNLLKAMVRAMAEKTSALEGLGIQVSMACAV